MFEGVRMLRQVLVVVLGHVDSGKTSLLDAIRGTNVQARESGAITQHIGASEIPLETIKGLCSEQLAKMGIKLTTPGLLVIDTPGHETFANLRRRGGSVADIAVVVVDVTKGIEAQTKESLQILRDYRVPFVVACNKIDLLEGWNPQKGECFSHAFEKQREDVRNRLDERVYKLMGEFYEQGFGAERFDRVTDFTKQVVIVPVSARTREGLSELLLFVSGLAQRFLEKRLEIHEGGKGTILELKEEKGLGKTLDIILYDGSLREGDEIAFASQTSVVLSKVKALLKPKPLDEMRDPREKFKRVSEVHAASGVKIACDRSEEALAGSSIIVVSPAQSVEAVQEEIQNEVKEILVEKEEDGVILKADALGSIEAITKLFGDEGIPVRKALIGSPTKKDLMEASSVGKEKKELGVVFAFNVPVEKEIEEEAERMEVKLFEENIIYNLVDNYKRWVEEEKAEERRKAFAELTLPAKIAVLPGACFRASNPCIFGIEVLSGVIKKGYEMMNAEGTMVGKIKEIQHEREPIQESRKGQQVAVSMDAPYFGRQIKEKQFLYSSISREEVKMIEEKYLQALSDEEKELLKEIRRIKGYSVF
ncbi:translation initiation factor IF-2 [Candidatus Micrarchaeota archaeon]|nr:translation initiation factor IF-2 [Candidatus Micrarchaeota archaeon]